MSIAVAGTSPLDLLTGATAPKSPAEPTAPTTGAAAAFAALLHAALVPNTIIEPKARVDLTANDLTLGDGTATNDEATNGTATDPTATNGTATNRTAANGTATNLSATPNGAATDALRFGLMTGDARQGVGRAADESATGAGAPPRQHHRAGAGAGHTPANAQGRRTNATEATETVASEGHGDVLVATELVASNVPTPPATVDATAAAAAAATAAAQAQAAAVTSTLTDVDPALRERVGRVVERMKSEFGHDVAVVESYRPQARQDWLYEQGRTRDGEIVTWTRNSQHTAGRAVDVTIDGGWSDRAAFATLQQVAQEEGLRTLGMRDPGHLELARDGAAVKITDAQIATPQPPLAKTATLALPQAPNAVAHVAEVATVAPVAQVAQVATVAMVAAPATPGVGRATKAPARESEQPATSVTDGAPAPAGARAYAAAARPTTTKQNGQQSTQRDGSDARDEQAKSRTTNAPRATTTMAAAPNDAPATPLRATAAAPVDAPAAPLGTDMVGRIARALEVRESAPVQPMSHITLRLDNMNGGEDRIRIGLRGIEVGTSIDVADRAAADRLRDGVGELRAALERHGLTTDTVQISSTARATEHVDASRLVAAAATGTERANAGSSSNTSDSNSQSRQQSQQDQRDASRDATRDDSRRQRRDAQDFTDDTPSDARRRARRGRQ